MRERLRSATQSAGARPSSGGRPTSAGGDTFEWNMRRAVGPTDQALYDCACGYKFTARVQTTVACPNCGAGQAW
jgi:hypothetical protein